MGVSAINGNYFYPEEEEKEEVVQANLVRRAEGLAGLTPSDKGALPEALNAFDVLAKVAEIAGDTAISKVCRSSYLASQRPTHNLAKALSEIEFFQKELSPPNYAKLPGVRYPQHSESNAYLEKLTSKLKGQMTKEQWEKIKELHPSPLSLSRFEAMQFVVQMNRDQATRALWNKISPNLRFEGSPPTSLGEIRAWMANPINQDQLKQIDNLTLSGHSLILIPPEIGNLTNLNHLDLSRNQIQVISLEIGNLTNLTHLNLRRNQIQVIPHEIGKLTNLTDLNLSENQIQVIPPEIGNLINLTHLNLRRNQIQGIPHEIGNLTNLLVLHLSKNQIQVIPLEIGKLTNLFALSLFENQIQVIPPEIGNLTNLNHLDLSGNQIQRIPPELGNLTNLLALYLSENQIQVIPLEIRKLTKLSRLNLSGNQIQDIPRTIGNLTNLFALDLSGNQIQVIPLEIGFLTYLRYLYLSGNQIQGIPHEFRHLISLEGLDLRDNQTLFIEQVPVNLRKITKLSRSLKSLSNRLIYHTNAHRGKITAVAIAALSFGAYELNRRFNP